MLFEAQETFLIIINVENSFVDLFEFYDELKHQTANSIYLE